MAVPGYTLNRTEQNRTEQHNYALFTDLKTAG